MKKLNVSINDGDLSPLLITLLFTYWLDSFNIKYGSYLKKPSLLICAVETVILRIPVTVETLTILVYELWLLPEPIYILLAFKLDN